MIMAMASVIESTDPKQIANVIIGEKIHQLMWRRKCTQAALGELLGIDQGSVSKRLRGKTTWSASEVLAVAAWLDVPITDLMPEMEYTGPEGPDGMVPPVGLEPTTCGLVNRQSHLLHPVLPLRDMAA